jgi:hypothetical protein
VGLEPLTRLSSFERPAHCPPRPAEGSLLFLRLRQNGFESGNEFRPFRGTQLSEIVQPPSNRRQVGCAGQLEKRPIGLSTLEGKKEASMWFGHARNGKVDQGFSGIRQVFETRSAVIPWKPRRNSA